MGIPLMYGGEVFPLITAASSVGMGRSILTRLPWPWMASISGCVCLLFVCLFFCLSVCLSICLSLSVFLSVCLSLCLSLCLSHMSLCLPCLSVSCQFHLNITSKP